MGFRVVAMVHRELVHVVRKVPWVHKAQWDYKDQKVRLVHQELMGLMVKMDYQVKMDYRAKMALMGKKVPKVLLDQQTH